MIGGWVITVLFLGGIFAFVVWLVLGAHRFLIRRKLVTQEQARSRLSPIPVGPAQTVLVKEEARASDVPLLDRFLTGNKFIPKLATALRQAGQTITPGMFLLIVAVCCVVGMLIGRMLGLLGMIGGGALGIALPRAWLQWRRQKCIAAFDEELPGAIDMLVSALKTGYSFHHATNFLGQELPPPLGPEFARVYDEQRLGMDPAQSLLGMQDRIGSIDMKMFVTAVLIQRKSGGNLTEVLGNTADVMRERANIRGQLETLTAEGKWSGRILAVLPVIVFFGLSWIAPQFMRPLRETDLGRQMIGFAAICVILGYIVMMKIAKVDF